jgi:hypothetical protein
LSAIDEPIGLIDLAAAARIYQRNQRRTDPNDRFHPVGDDIFPSVTGLIHAVLKSPGLEAWLLNGRIEAYQDDLLRASATAKTAEGLRRAIRDTRFPYRGKDQGDAAGIGTRVHAAIEWALRGEMGLEVGELPDLAETEADCFGRWGEWWATAGLRPLALEKELVCRACGYAGHADLIAERIVDGRPVVVDWKTSKAVFADYRLQLSAYGHAEGVTDGLVVRIGKKPGEQVEEIWLDDLPAVFPLFTGLLTTWRWLRGLSGHDTGTPPTGDHTLEDLPLAPASARARPPRPLLRP